MMRFQVGWASGDDKPCDKAWREKHPFIDARTVDDPEKIAPGFSETWYAYGKNHRVVDGMICRDMSENEHWFVEVDSLEELLALCKEIGHPFIIEPVNFVLNEWMITIYNSPIE